MSFVDNSRSGEFGPVWIEASVGCTVARCLFPAIVLGKLETDQTQLLHITGLALVAEFIKVPVSTWTKKGVITAFHR